MAPFVARDYEFAQPVRATGNCDYFFDARIVDTQHTFFEDGQKLSIGLTGCERVHWERQLRCYISAHVAVSLYRRHGFVRLHAAAFTHGVHTTVLVGPSGAGKSTLTAIAVATMGATYLGHECIFMNKSLEVAAWPQPVTLDHISTRHIEGAWGTCVGLHPEPGSLKAEVHIPQSKTGRCGMPSGLLLLRRLSTIERDNCKSTTAAHAFRFASQQIEYPNAFPYLPLEQTEDYIGDALDIIGRLTRSVPCHYFNWRDSPTAMLREYLQHGD